MSSTTARCAHPVLLATASYLPERELDNDALRAAMPADREFFDRLEGPSGIRTRFRARPDQAASDLVVEAARVALRRAGTSADELDLIVVGTDSPDYMTPCTSVVVQHKLGAARAGTFDVGCGCASFPTALSAAAALMQANPHLRRVLVAGAYMMSRLCDASDRMQFFYGDGAGVAVLGRGSEPSLVSCAFRAEGQYSRHWGIFAGGTVAPATEERVRRKETCVRMVDKMPREVNDEGWPQVVRSLAEHGQFSMSDVDCLVLTQVREQTVHLVADTLGIERRRAHTIMREVGYTGSACIPMALDDAIERGRAVPGDLVVLVGSGVGLNQAGVALRLTQELWTPHETRGASWGR